MDDLYAACRKGSEYDVKQSLKFFLHRVNDPNPEGYTPLYLASLCSGDKVSIVNLLVANGANVNLTVKDGSTPLIASAEEGNVECLKALLQDAAQVNTKKQNGRTALIAACWEQHLPCVEALLDSGADTNLASNTGCSALYFACRSNDKGNAEKIVRLLLAHHADPNIATKSGRSPLHEAAEHGLDSIVTLLIAAGADVNLQDSHGQTAWDLAKNALVRKALMVQQMEDLLQQSSTLCPLLSYEAEDPFISPPPPLAEETPMSAEWNMAQQQPSTPPPKPPRQRAPLTHLNSQHQRLLLTLAEASPQTITYLRSLGDNGSISEAQYQQIMATPGMKQFYLQFNRTLSSVSLALLVINSKIINDARNSNPEKFLDIATALAQSSSLPAVPLAANLIRFLVKLPFAMDRANRVRALTTVFPSIDSHKFIEILARELTVEQRIPIEELYQSDLENTNKMEKRSVVVERLISGVSWVYEAISGNESGRWNNVQFLAEACAGRLLEQLMLQGENLGIIELQNLLLLKAWAMGFETPQEYESERRQLMEQGMMILTPSIPSELLDDSQQVPPELEIPICQTSVVNEGGNGNNNNEQVQQLQEEVIQLTAKLVAITKKVDRFERLEQKQNSPMSNTSSPSGSRGDGQQILQQVQAVASSAANAQAGYDNASSLSSDLLQLQQQVARLEEAVIHATTTLQPMQEVFEEVSLQSPKSSALSSRRQEGAITNDEHSPVQSMTVDTTQGCCKIS